jgi:hypothetical protein
MPQIKSQELRENRSRYRYGSRWVIGVIIPLEGIQGRAGLLTNFLYVKTALLQSN